jgi:hypothetical protein
VGADLAEGTLGLSPVRYDDDDDSKDGNDFAAFFVNCSFTALFLLFFTSQVPKVDLNFSNGSNRLTYSF